MSARYARRWSRAARGDVGGSQVSEHAEQKPLSLPWNVAQLLHGYGAAAANSSSSKAPEPCGGGLQRSSGTASNVDGAAVGALDLHERCYSTAALLLIVRTGPRPALLLGSYGAAPLCADRAAPRF